MNAISLPNVKKVVIIGPECTGKSDLANFLATQLKTDFVPEYARGYLNNLQRPYTKDDLPMIARGQLRLEDEFSSGANQVLICDTNLYVIKVWSEFKYGNCDPQILQQIETRPYDLYLLTYIDIPWENDPQREHPDRREELFNVYHTLMKGQKVPFVLISGDREQRQKTALEAVHGILNS